VHGRNLHLLVLDVDDKYISRLRTRFSRRRCYATFDPDRRPRDNGPMNEKHPYEAVGIRPDGDGFTVEILGHQTEGEADAD